MTARYHDYFSTRETPQSKPIPGREADMAENAAGGYAFEITDWSRLDRFLILGAEGGTYYASEQELSVENARCVFRCVQQDGLRAVARIVEISKSGRAPKNDPALFALAIASGSPELDVRRAAFQALPKVARIGTHLFAFVEYRKAFGGRGHQFRRAIQRWYLDKDIDAAAFQIAKYQQRNRWSHRDLLRLVKPVPPDDRWNALFAWAVGKTTPDAAVPNIIRGMKTCQFVPIKGRAGQISAYGLQREMVPTEWLKDPQVWAALLEDMPMMAMVRNLGNMGSVGLLKPMSDTEHFIINRLGNKDLLRKSRIHPLAILLAMETYRQGHGFRGSNTWVVSAKVVDALDGAFYDAFDNVEATGKRHLLGLDVSGSMGRPIMGAPIDARTGCAALALVAARTESDTHTMAFTSRFAEFPISHRSTLPAVVDQMCGMEFGGTDCALPMLYALEHSIPVDVFVVYTDNETWAGPVHPVQALRQYREAMGVNAKLIVVGMTSTGFSIADPQDPGMLDVVGFDAALPQVMREFSMM